MRLAVAGFALAAFLTGLYAGRYLFAASGVVVYVIALLCPETTTDERAPDSPSSARSSD